ncbi:YALIA101S05e07140g1_1 [Yarrowia lipolytica]|nr:Multisite-specific tRNA:(cytosine-C(5))-methyltransferase [Yarrowia lipolytica]SEI34642.1 YALIA101S05e07140g1_1 [Yarrowia lipolytica]VBB79026.1 S-adenosyl-L-methionine-dependent tRNA: m5C-methyltransferase, putative [Yarrowia lipolytica]
MGKYPRKKNNQNNRDKNDDGRRKSGWEDVVKENEKWEKYYKAQGIVPEAEWGAFKTACQSPLPVSFRVTGSTELTDEIQAAIVDDYVPHLSGLVFEGEEVVPPQNIKFYPNNHGWQFNVRKTVVRKQKLFSRFHRFLVLETTAGNISRQEAVSMIPPILLDVQPSDAVLDMCAAPGSKTAQLIEAVHAGGDLNPSGFVIANDSDYKRSHMLIHQVQRLNSPNLIVTNHDAQMYPKVAIAAKGVDGAKSNEYLKFDRILCDVPCSGDATMRKNVNVWPDWTPGNALGLHQLQLNILMRGIQLLKPGGRLVYSTCSLNPIENEAVVAEALRLSKGSVHLIESRGDIPNLINSKGMTDWKVQAKGNKDGWNNKGDEGCTDSWFPPTDESIKEQLTKCIRVYPHTQDTGGFFIVAFEKAKDVEEEDDKKRVAEDETRDAKRVKVDASDIIDAAKETASDAKEAVVDAAETVKEAVTDAAETVKEKFEGVVAEVKEDAKDEEPKKSKKMPYDANEEPFVFVDPNHEELQKCWDFYKFNDQFPRDSMMVRNHTGEPTRTIYYTSPSIKPILELNANRLKFVHAGTRFFTLQKNEDTCKWRIQSESVNRAFPYIGARVVKGNLDIIKFLATTEFPKFEILEKEYPEFAKEVSAHTEGCLILTAQYNDREICLPMWRGKMSANLMINKQDKEEFLHRVFKIEGIKTRGQQQQQKPVAAESAERAQGQAEAAKAVEEAKQENEQAEIADEVVEENVVEKAE